MWKGSLADVKECICAGFSFTAVYIIYKDSVYKASEALPYMGILQICRIVNRPSALYIGNIRKRLSMMTYDPFWKMMEEREISTYSLEIDYGFNKAVINRLKHNKNMNLSSIDYICEVFSCSVEEVVVHVGNKK